MAQIVIVGNGVAGITAAQNIRRLSTDNICVISSESEYFFSRTALMYVYLGQQRWKDIEPYPRDYWTKNKIDLLNTRIISIDFSLKLLWTEDGETISYDKLILATGSKSKTLDVPGSDLLGVSYLYSKQDLEHIERLTPGMKHAVIVGGGLIGVELCEMLQSRQISVTLLIRDPYFHAGILPEDEGLMVSRHIEDRGVRLIRESQLKEICPDESGKLAAVITDQGERISCDFVGITIGISPNIDLVKNSPLECDRGILVNEYFETNIKDVYAIGDCVQLREPLLGRAAIETSWYIAKKMGELLAANLYGQKQAYHQKTWINAAKFFNIEYQAYGMTPAQIKYPLNSMHWESPGGQKSIRLIYDQDARQIKGFLSLGYRLRQDVCELWIRENWLLERVVSKIKQAHFNSEFSFQPATILVRKFNITFGKFAMITSFGTLDGVLRLFRRYKRINSLKNETQI